MLNSTANCGSSVFRPREAALIFSTQICKLFDKSALYTVTTSGRQFFQSIKHESLVSLARNMTLSVELQLKSADSAEKCLYMAEYC